jgi:hypothetical protein
MHGRAQAAWTDLSGGLNVSVRVWNCWKRSAWPALSSFLAWCSKYVITATVYVVSDFAGHLNTMIYTVVAQQRGMSVFLGCILGI